TPMPYKKQGYTLLEMSIVMAIIGLLVGGIAVGRSIVKTAQIRSAIGEYDVYLKAIKEFQDKYTALPGDFPTAETLWGTDPVACPNTTSSTAKKTTTCNGNGNGRIGASTTLGVLSGDTEWWRAWQHLSNAGMI